MLGLFISQQACVKVPYTCLQVGVCGWNQWGVRLRHEEDFYSWNGAFWCILGGKGGCSDRDMLHVPCQISLCLLASTTRALALWRRLHAFFDPLTSTWSEQCWSGGRRKGNINRTVFVLQYCVAMRNRKSSSAGWPTGSGSVLQAPL